MVYASYTKSKKIDWHGVGLLFDGFNFVFFKFWPIPVFCDIYIYIQGYVTLYCVRTHLIIISCIIYIYILVGSTFCKMCILMLHSSLLFTKHMPLYIIYAYNNYLSSLLICVAFIVMWDPQIVRKMMHILIIPIFHLWDEIPSCTYTTLSCWWKVNCLGKMRWYDFIFYIYILYFLLGYR